MIDFHCHLDLFPDPAAVIERTGSTGTGLLSVTNTPSAWRGTAQLAAGRGGIRTALGLHPQLARQRRRELALFDELLPQTMFVGEVGLDGSPPYRDFWQDQIDVLEHLLMSCEAAGGRVISAHTRQAVVPFLESLASHPGAGLVILHWFSGSRSQLSVAVKAGCWFSVGPAMLAGAKGRELVSEMPRDRVLLETDGPFAQLKGTALGPWNVTLAARMIADVWEADLGEVRDQIESNEQALKTWVSAIASRRLDQE